MSRLRGHALGLALCMAGLAHGQEVTAERPAPGATEMHRVSQILGSTVRLNDGGGYGQVEDLVLGPDNRIEYLVVSHDGQYVPLPWGIGQFNPGQRVVVYDVAPQALQPLRFAPNAWPNFADPAFTRRVRTIFPSMTRREGAGVATPPGAPVRPGAARPQAEPADRPREGADIPKAERPRRPQSGEGQPPPPPSEPRTQPAPGQPGAAPGDRPRPAPPALPAAPEPPRPTPGSPRPAPAPRQS